MSKSNNLSKKPIYEDLIDRCYASDTAEVKETVAGFQKPGLVKRVGGIYWRAVSAQDVVILRGQRVRIIKRLSNSLLLLVEPICFVREGRPALHIHDGGIEQKSRKDSKKWLRQAG
ncbi:MAG: NfeD family protein [Cyanobacteria bacterium P01_A01_bin.17]